MRMNWMDWFMHTLLGVLALMALVLIGIFFVYIPAMLRAEATCLSMGYPKAEVTYKLDAYCLNLNGAVTVRVEPIKEK